MPYYANGPRPTNFSHFHAGRDGIVVSPFVSSANLAVEIGQDFEINWMRMSFLITITLILPTEFPMSPTSKG
jgi:hypothetical protein